LGFLLEASSGPAAGKLELVEKYPAGTDTVAGTAPTPLIMLEDPLV